MIVSESYFAYNAVMNLEQDRTVKEIINRLTKSHRADVIKTEGSWGSFGRFLVLHISKTIRRPILYICPHIDDAEKLVDEAQTFGSQMAEVFSAWEGQEDIADATDEIRTERLRLVSQVANPALKQEPNRLIISASIQSICQPITNPKVIESGSLKLHISRNITPEYLSEWLVENAQREGRHL